MTTDQTATPPTHHPTDPSTDRRIVHARYRAHISSSLATIADILGAPIEVRSAGTRVYDEHDTPFLDCGGYGVFLLGHRHPAVIEAVRRQLDTHTLATKLLLVPQLAEAAETLASVTPPGLDHVVLTNSGAEATELGLKLARLAGRTRVLATAGGFHGKTLGALSVTGRQTYRAPFQPLLPGVEFVPFGDADVLATALDRGGSGAAVILEPVQGEGGVVIPPVGYLAEVRRLCTAAGALLVLDEIQTGLGRLGAWWGADAEGVRPDILLSGKVLSGGVIPVGAVVATSEVFAPLDADPLLHSSTYGGNPLAAAAVTATIRTIRDEDIVSRSAVLGDRIKADATRILGEHCPWLVREVRGRGLLIGLDFAEASVAAEFLMAMLEQRVVTSYSLNTHSVVRLTPPATLDEDDLAWLSTAMRKSALDLARRHPRRANERRAA